MPGKPGNLKLSRRLIHWFLLFAPTQNHQSIRSGAHLIIVLRAQENQVQHMNSRRNGGYLRIAVIGDFEPSFLSHFATNAALYDAAAKLGSLLELRWLSTPSLDGASPESCPGDWDGLVASPGSPYKSFSGMLRAIEFARTHNRPFYGT